MQKVKQNFNLKKISTVLIVGFFIVGALVTVPSYLVLSQLESSNLKNDVEKLDKLFHFLKVWGFFDPRSPYIENYLDSSIQFQKCVEGIHKSDAMKLFYQLEAIKGRIHFSEENLFKLTWYGKKNLFELLAKEKYEVEQIQAKYLNGIQEVIRQQNRMRQNVMAAEVYREFASKINNKAK